MESFIFYESFYEAIKLLPKEEKADAYEAIAEYSLTGVEPINLKGMATVIFTMAKPQIDANNKRRLNGLQGGRPKKATDCFKEEKTMVLKQDETCKVKVFENENLQKPLVLKNESTQKPNDNVNVNENGNNNKKNKTKKIIFDEIEYNDWEKLFAYWVQEKAGTKYTDEGRQYAFGKLKDLSGDDFYVASEAIRHAALNKYQGFFNGNGLFYDIRKCKKDISSSLKSANSSDIRAFLAEVKNEHSI